MRLQARPWLATNCKMLASAPSLAARGLGGAYRLLVRPLLFRFDPETAHDTTLAILARLEAALCSAGCAPEPPSEPRLRSRVFGLDFPNPIGLAAGLDKDARAPHVWPLLGFGFAELGTVTAEAQPGNPPPRLFRFPEQHAIVNRMGFNNAGAQAVAEHLARTCSRLAPRAPIGINIGKSRRTPLQDAAEDYARSFRLLAPWADYVCLNVSSPNTPGLRDLQAKDHLKTLLTRIRQENADWAKRARSAQKPVLLKVAPDLDEQALEDVVGLALDFRVAGIVATNTTTDLRLVQAPPGVEGGVSGAPLRARATATVRALYRLAAGKIPIVGVGGIFTAADAYEKIRAGASLVQLYTALIFTGPDLAWRLNEELLHLLERDGFRHLTEAVGCES